MLVMDCFWAPDSRDIFAEVVKKYDDNLDGMVDGLPFMGPRSSVRKNEKRVRGFNNYQPSVYYVRRSCNNETKYRHHAGRVSHVVRIFTPGTFASESPAQPGLLCMYGC